MVNQKAKNFYGSVTAKYVMCFLFRFVPKSYYVSWLSKSSSWEARLCTDLAELHLQVVRVTAVVEQGLFKSLNDPSFDVVVQSGRKLQAKQSKIYHQDFFSVSTYEELGLKPLQYLSDVNDFVQLREEPLDGIVDLPNPPLGDADPSRHWGPKQDTDAG